MRNGLGFTLIEILIVLGLIAILTTFVLPTSIYFYRSQQLETHSQGILQTLRRAQLKAISIEKDASFGVYLTNDNYVLFKGVSYATRDVQYDEVYDLSNIITLSGLSEVIFSKFEGIPNTTGNIVLNSNSESRTININEMGTISLVPAVLLGFCAGTPTTCDTFLNQTSCLGQEGCSWAPGSCAGTCTPCDTLDKNTCGDVAGCNWSGRFKICTGTCTACDGGSFQDQTLCEAQLGCFWIPEVCSGVPTTCENYNNQTECEVQAGCTWVF